MHQPTAKKQQIDDDAINPSLIQDHPTSTRTKRMCQPTAKKQQIDDDAINPSLIQDCPTSTHTKRPQKPTVKQQKDETKRVAEEDDAMYWKYVDSDHIDWDT